MASLRIPKESSKAGTRAAQFDVSKEGDEEVVEMIRGFLKAGTDNLMQLYGEA